MILEDKVGWGLASQEIRGWVEEGRIAVPKFDESRIQPSSFEPVIGSEAFILDIDNSCLFRCDEKKTVYQTLLELPGRQRRKVSLNDGFELKKGFTYLLPLEEKITLSAGGFVKSSPKSSFGRLFINTRLLADYNPCFDEINSSYKEEKSLDLWILVQPLAFNVIAHPGLCFNQLRFFRNYNGHLSPTQLKEELQVHPILHYRQKDGSLIPAPHLIGEGLDIHLDLKGRYSEGIVGLRARHNPEPLNLGKKGEYKAEEFFEPIKEGKVRILPDEYYLLASAEVLKVPSHLSVELASHSHIGISGPLHFAGFIDNGFVGDLVFEVRSDELGAAELEHGMPISRLNVFHTEIPDKLYGPAIGSNYQLQVGPRPPKYFGPFDYVLAAKNYAKLDREVLVGDVKLLKAGRRIGCLEYIDEAGIERLEKEVQEGFFQSRYDCEDDLLLRQFLPYVLLFGPDETIFSYVRSKDIKEYGEKKLFGKHSVGLGGHIIRGDGAEFISNCVQREVVREEVRIKGNYTPFKLIGTLVVDDLPVDQVHFGIVLAAYVEGTVRVKKKEKSISSGSMVPISQILSNPDYPKQYETWSRILIPELSHIYQIVRSS
ncbi:MAG: 2'-deoxycytidine 5'-triphosphate deaminase [Candidatus Woesearchaeota archaeon]